MSKFPEASQSLGLRPSRLVVVAFIGVFLVGVLVGTILYSTFEDMRLPQFLTKTGDPKSMADRINEKYNREFDLSPAEQAAIAPLTREMTQHLYLTRRQFGVDVIATLDDYHQKIADQMSPAHRVAYQKAMDEKKKRISAMLLLDPPAAGAGQK